MEDSLMSGTGIIGETVLGGLSGRVATLTIGGSGCAIRGRLWLYFHRPCKVTTAHRKLSKRSDIIIIAKNVDMNQIVCFSIES